MASVKLRSDIPWTLMGDVNFPEEICMLRRRTGSRRNSRCISDLSGASRLQQRLMHSMILVSTHTNIFKFVP